MLRFRLMISMTGAALALVAGSALVSAHANLGGGASAWNGSSVASVTWSASKGLGSSDVETTGTHQTSSPSPSPACAAARAADATEDANEKKANTGKDADTAEDKNERGQLASCKHTSPHRAARAACKAAESGEDASEKTAKLSKADDATEDQKERATLSACIAANTPKTA
jgi:hypothetical protein